MQYKDLLINLVARDLKLKYKGSIIGILWSLLNPLAMLIIYNWVFGTIMHSQIEHFPLFLMSGLLPWNFFSSFVSMSVSTFTSNSGLITKVKLPNYIFPLSNLMFTGIIFLMMILIILISMPIFGVPYTSDLLYLPISIVLQLIFSFGLGLFLGTLNVFFHDTAHLVEILLMMWFWLTPVVYPFDIIPKKFQFLISLNPMTLIINLYQKSIMGMEFYSSVLSGVIGILFVLCLGIYTYKKYTYRIAEFL
jgi:ABC-type polysaccharide/polyol phosphate export permease